MNINDFISIGIIGAVLSTLIECVQRIFGVTSGWTKVLSISLSFVIGTAYYFLSTTPYWPTVLGVLGAASTVYAILFNSKAFKSSGTVADAE